MVRKLRIAAVASITVAAVVAVALWGAYLATRHVRPFYQQALRLDRETLEQGHRELNSRASTLYTDARHAGAWHALFTADQINGWLAVQLTEQSEDASDEATPSIDSEEWHRVIREPRIAISPDLVTLGFTTTRGGVDTVVSVDATVLLTDEGDVAVRLLDVRAGALPLPVTLLADEIAAACQDLDLPVLWTRMEGCPVAMIKIRRDESADGLLLHLDSIELHQDELYVAGHTESVTPPPTTAGDRESNTARETGSGEATPRTATNSNVDLEKFELRLSPKGKRAMLEIARRPGEDHEKSPR